MYVSVTFCNTYVGTRTVHEFVLCPSTSPTELLQRSYVPYKHSTYERVRHYIEKERRVYVPQACSVRVVMGLAGSICTVRIHSTVLSGSVQ